MGSSSCTAFVSRMEGFTASWSRERDQRWRCHTLRLEEEMKFAMGTLQYRSCTVAYATT